MVNSICKLSFHGSSYTNFGEHAIEYRTGLDTASKRVVAGHHTGIFDWFFISFPERFRVDGDYRQRYRSIHHFDEHIYHIDRLLPWKCF